MVGRESTIHPAVKMGDFALAYWTGQEDGANPGWYLGVGTRGQKPPVSTTRSADEFCSTII